ncbi:Phenylalanine ammonia-lyase [Talaromyces islandicus]|uniref:Phenylalanine ammonia-lyase n=1 Tax=Talaromyces islandicus TaxID=28573 RepID=A0A0U1LVW0_TALIS|nr:Phenylalanine ammonia-lyase [Talaromyces islandicus]
MNHTDIVLREWESLESLICRKDSATVVLTGNTLTIPDVIAVARYNVLSDIDVAAIKVMEKSLSMLEKRMLSGDVIYGVNTGFGGSADIRTKKLIELQRALIRELHYGILPTGERDHRPLPLEEVLAKHRLDLSLESGLESTYLPRSWARASILIRINSLISGCSAVRPVIVQRMQDLLKHDIIPMIPLRGSISSSGDLSPLSYICGAIQGKSTIRVLSRDHHHLYADSAFTKAGLEPVVIQAKEGLAMTNGTTVSAAVASLALHDTHSLALLAQILTAMSVEALNGTVESFHPFFSEVRPHPGQVESARNILAFLSGSKLTKVNDGAHSSLRQDRYSIRTAPQWLGPILEDLSLAHHQVFTECNSATDNPLVTPEGEFIHGGNFQAKSVTSAMEKARQGIQGIGRMLFSQCTEIINPATNRGLPPNLVAEDPGISLIFKGTDLHIASLAAELGFLASPVNHVQTAEMGNQSLNSLALISARYTHTANEVLSQLMAAHLIAVCQALDLRAMHVQFLEYYYPKFFQLVDAHYAEETAPSDFPPKIPIPIEASADLPKDLAEPQLKPVEPKAVKSLSELLWTQLLAAFDTTTSMDAQERFPAMAKSLRSVLLDHVGFNTAADFAPRLQSFTEALSASLHDAWCAHRDAYLVHGDAASLLGTASRAMYVFLRRTLGIPLLATRSLSTPTADRMNGDGGVEAPTVGSYTGAVYRALRDGTVAKVAVDILRDSV